MGERPIPCEMRDCRRPAVAFMQGRHVCREHDPPGSPSCSHSLAPSCRCAYCGGHTRTDELDTLELHLAHLEAARHLESTT